MVFKLMISYKYRTYMSALEAAGAFTVLAWLYLLLGRGFFWLVREAGPVGGPAAPRRVAVVIPARNEARVVGKAVASVTAQEYAGPLQVVVIDDHSTDGTAGAAHGARVIPAGPLPEGWTGKLWAISEGVREAEAFAPDYFLPVGTGGKRPWC
jgi:hypothetical protein